MEPHIRHTGIRDVQFGTDVTVVAPVNLYGCKIGDSAFIGPFVEIQPVSSSAKVRGSNPIHSSVSW